MLSVTVFQKLLREVHELHKQLSWLCKQPKPVYRNQLEPLRTQAANARQLVWRLQKLDGTEPASAPSDSPEGTLVSKVIAIVDARLKRRASAVSRAS